MHLQGGDTAPRAYRAWRCTGSADPQALALSEINSTPLDNGFLLVRNAAIVALGALHDHGSDFDWARLGGTFEHLPRQLDALKHRAFTGKSIVTIE
jgi:hypothetical protein